ncbi:unnamed protein product, partial [Staurois parvus]
VVQERVAIYKRHPHLQPVRTPCECAAPAIRCPWTQQNTDRSTGPLCEVPIHVITDWPISDLMNSSKQDVTS